MYCTGSGIGSSDSLASLFADNGRMFPSGEELSLTSHDHIVLLVTSNDVTDVSQIVALSHYNLVACWTQLR